MMIMKQASPVLACFLVAPVRIKTTSRDRNLFTMSASTTLTALPTEPALVHLLGIGSAVASMVCWVITSMAFTTAGRRYGSTTVNVTRSVLALGILLVTVWILSGRFLPFPSDQRLYWLALSGLFGLAVGDQLIFSAFNRIGPRLTLLMLNLAPVLTALIAWPVIDEPLSILGWLGMGITIAGVSWVITDRNEVSSKGRIGPTKALYDSRLGVTLALAGVVAVSIGNVLAKLGMLPSSNADADAGGVDPLIAQDIRMIAGAVTIVIMACCAGALGRRIGSPPEPRVEDRPRPAIAIGAIGIGTILGPVLGIFFFLYSAALIEVAITATIVAVTPIAILPFNRFIEGTRLSKRAILGSFVGVAGVIILALGPAAADSDHPDGRPTPAAESLEFGP